MAGSFLVEGEVLLGSLHDLPLDYTYHYFQYAIHKSRISICLLILLGCGDRSDPDTKPLAILKWAFVMLLTRRSSSIWDAHDSQADTLQV